MSYLLAFVLGVWWRGACHRRNSESVGLEGPFPPVTQRDIDTLNGANLDRTADEFEADFNLAVNRCRFLPPGHVLRGG